jgi:hypothetical protein
MGELLQISWLLSPLLAQNAILVQGHVMLKPLWIIQKVHVGSNLLYFSLKAFPVSCQSCCSVCTDADAVCPRNIFCCETVIHCLEYITPCTFLWKR